MQSRGNGEYNPLGEFETIVLMAVLRLGKNAYGALIHQEIEKRTERRSSFGAVYTTLNRLEDKGFLSSSVGEPTAERGGRAKKYFQLKAAGAKALRRSYGETTRMAQGIEPLLGA
jgi:PadR family transcriptional regulator, regulatory protein PadR